MGLGIGGLYGLQNTDNIYNRIAAGQTDSITKKYDAFVAEVAGEEKTDTFETMFQSALGLVNVTNEYSNAAEEEELNYAMGLSEDTHSLMIAQQKANISLQYTVAVRDAVIDAYNEIMNMQF